MKRVELEVQEVIQHADVVPMKYRWLIGESVEGAEIETVDVPYGQEFVDVEVDAGVEYLISCGLLDADDKIIGNSVSAKMTWPGHAVRMPVRILMGTLPTPS